MISYDTGLCFFPWMCFSILKSVKLPFAFAVYFIVNLMLQFFINVQQFSIASGQENFLRGLYNCWDKLCFLMLNSGLGPKIFKGTLNLLFRFSPHVVESGKFLLVESGIPLTTGCGTQVPLTKNLECTAWNPESKTVLDSLTSGDSLFRDANMQIVCHVANSPSMSQDHESSMASMLESHGIFLKLGRNYEKSW